MRAKITKNMAVASLAAGIPAAVSNLALMTMLSPPLSGH
jgi:hypothetical protein